ncbi:MAG: gamma-glutamyltransferase, partial [Planctomycetota bacterium]
PGCVSGWADLSAKFGKLAFEDLMAPAIRYAREGYAVTPIIAGYWSRAEERFGKFEEFAKVFLPEPKVGEIWKSEDHAQTLEDIAATKGESFYRGRLADKIAAAAKDAGAAMTADDLGSHENIWYDETGLVSSEAFGARLFEIPPNTQGIAATMAWGICGEIAGTLGDLDWHDPRGMHLQHEAMKLAFADLHAHVADADAMHFSPQVLVDPAYLAGRAKLVNADKAEVYAAGVPKDGGTINLTTADDSGMMVSLIQSNFAGFGSGIVIPGTGIAMQNRGAGFVLDEGHPNEVGPSKRPFHTIIPGFVKVGGKPDLAFQLMGGPMQAQGHLQMMLHIYAAGHDIQRAVDAPRWQITQGHELMIERGFDAAVIDDLKQRGHLIEERGFVNFGGAQMIRSHDNGVFSAASDPRKDGHAAGF